MNLFIHSMFCSLNFSDFGLKKKNFWLAPQLFLRYIFFSLFVRLHQTAQDYLFLFTGTFALLLNSTINNQWIPFLIQLKINRNSREIEVSIVAKTVCCHRSTHKHLHIWALNKKSIGKILFKHFSYWCFFLCEPIFFRLPYIWLVSRCCWSLFFIIQKLPVDWFHEIFSKSIHNLNCICAVYFIVFIYLIIRSATGPFRMDFYGLFSINSNV